jgi:transposase
VLKFFASLPPCLVGMEACATAHWPRADTPQIRKRLTRNNADAPRP